MEESLKEICLSLFDIGALKFGDFKMKVGLNSPVYFDLRVIISHPLLMNKLAEIVLLYMKQLELKCNLICGVPYTALPISTLVSAKSNIPMVIRRKEPKSYGTMKLIEGDFKSGENCLIIEDVVTSGGSILETAKDLQKDALHVTDTIVLVDRQQGGSTNLTNNDIKMHPLLTLSKVMEILCEHGKLDKNTVDKVNTYISDNQILPNGRKMTKNKMTLSYKERAFETKSSSAKKLFDLMERKETNLCAALDVTKSADLLKLADMVGPYVCIVKTHQDCIEDWDSNTENSLKQLSEKHDFFIMEDRKFGDIGNTVKLQCEKVFTWCDFVTVHSIGGPGVLEGALQASQNASKPKGVFLVAELSSKANLILPQYTKATVALGEARSEFVMGFVCQDCHVFNDPGFIQLTPGVSPKTDGDSLGQQYCKPEDAVLVKGGDVIVVGRAIYQSEDPKAAAETLKCQLWNAYKNRLVTRE
ncbi:uridine 5'-monophosphate synthase isoform X2 [Cimex lectularius]|uniref:Uridine 5'-monophosphate synthase n=1 Tax=Cimex lectularius TaxID=79782 RepID=A0A8I6S8B1_CIMLE|nr:uridine 5'-monophosphate synthase isoform X2 [Cimex lectularius]